MSLNANVPLENILETERMLTSGRGRADGSSVGCGKAMKRDAFAPVISPRRKKRGECAWESGYFFNAMPTLLQTNLVVKAFLKSVSGLKTLIDTISSKNFL
jgi:hypothetical protein